MSNPFDLLVVTDATGSMGQYLDALRTSIPEILALAKLSGAFQRLGVISYKDYCDRQVFSWSGWNADLSEFVGTLSPTGGGDYPEAAKTALIHALKLVDKNSKTILLWFTDAPPHHVSNRLSNNGLAEINAFPKGATDWVKLCHTAANRNCTVFSFAPTRMSHRASSFYVLLSELTGGTCIKSNIDSNTSHVISRLTLGAIMQWMGQSSNLEVVVQESQATFMRYKVSPLSANPKPLDEGSGSRGYIPPSNSAHTPLLEIIESPLNPSDIPRGSLSTELSNLAKRFANPAETVFHDQVYDSLASIIESNIFCLTYNPVFGQLWRAVCKDTSDRKNRLLDAFSNSVGNVKDPTQKAGLQQWLEDSFDATDEIEAIIAKEDANGPRVYLDLDTNVELTRTELLEVSKSCYASVLKKVASIFTHLKLLEPGVTLMPNQRTLPLSLPPREFFRILPHLVVRGTLYSQRAAAITAILALVTAVPFLREPATGLLLPLKGTWLNVEVPENVSFACARLLLSAPEGTVMTEEEKNTYEAMNRYKLIELNLGSSIEVQVPWTPVKTRGVGDRKVQCKKCLISRSITLMSEEQIDVCGLCIVVGGEPQQFPSRSDLESCWVECSMTKCRAQYVVEDVSALKIQPKCHYCRTNIRCPWLECSRCANRVIVPAPYRSSKDQDYCCPACENSTHESTVVTIVSHVTTTQELVSENGVDWLGFPRNEGILKGKSAFKLFQTHGAAAFGHSPEPGRFLELTLNGKKIFNAEQALAQVERRVGSGEVESGTCALCFEEMPKTKLMAACGRTGCNQTVDSDCLREWYGRSEPGKLLNLMRLSCPFCRRKPTIKTLTRYNRRAATLGGLQQAMDDRHFFYAWCLDCGFAKQSHERVCCEGDRVPLVENFRCTDCTRTESTSGQPIRLTNCPQCGVMVEKIDGCNHISCLCGQHFCHACGTACSQEEIYRHMSMEHGGFYDDFDEE